MFCRKWTHFESKMTKIHSKWPIFAEELEFFTLKMTFFTENNPSGYIFSEKSKEADWKLIVSIIFIMIEILILLITESLLSLLPHTFLTTSIRPLTTGRRGRMLTDTGRKVNPIQVDLTNLLTHRTVWEIDRKWSRSWPQKANVRHFLCSEDWLAEYSSFNFFSSRQETIENHKMNSDDFSVIDENIFAHAERRRFRHRSFFEFWDRK